MKQLKTLFAVTAALCCMAVNSQAVVTGLFNTGVDGAGVSQAHGTTPDLHYTLFNAAGDVPVTTKVLTSSGGWPIPPWLPDSAISAWVGPNAANADAPVGSYYFQTTFTAAIGDVVTGHWSTDNPGIKIQMNGVDTLNSGTAANQFEIGYVDFSVIATVNGVNTLRFYVDNISDSINPLGLRVEFSPVPEPTTMIAGGLLLLPFAASTLRFVRRSRVATV